MTAITYLKLTRKNFDLSSLDEFKRYQDVKECWRLINNRLVLIPCEFVEDWDLNRCRGVAKEILKAIDQKCIAYGAYYQGNVIGYIYLINQLFGSANQYIELRMFHISEPFRQQGIGKRLFKLACEDAKNLGVSKLYISAHSSKESQTAYRRIGCVDAIEVNSLMAEHEPFDIQMEYQL